MTITKLNIIKNDERGIVYDCDGLMYVARKKGTITADHTHEDIDEILYLIDGVINLTIGNKTEKIEAPSRIEIPRKIYHKIVAISNVVFIKK